MVAADSYPPIHQQYYDDNNDDDDDDDMNGDSISSSSNYNGINNVNPESSSSPPNNYNYNYNGVDVDTGNESNGNNMAGLDDGNNKNMMMMNSTYDGDDNYLVGDDGGDIMGRGDDDENGEGGMLHNNFHDHNNHNLGNDRGGDIGGGGIVVDFDDPRIASLPRILLMGPRRAGKTSIQRVVFHKMSPHETLFRLEATQLLERAVVDHTPLCRFTIWDFPGELYEGSGGSGYEFSSAAGGNEGGGGGGQDGYSDDHGRGGGGGGGGDATLSSFRKNNHHQGGNAVTPTTTFTDDQIFAKATALIFVLDAQDEPYDHVLQSFTDTVTRAIRSNPSIAIEVFVHKVDGELFLSDEAKYDCRRDVMQQVADELADAGLSHDAIPISYHLTSIYDHSVFEAFSRVVQRLIPELPTLENLLNVLVSTCSMEKAYLFDVASKLYISTDSSPVDMQSVELCSDMIDVVLDVSGIYGMGGGKMSTAPGYGTKQGNNQQVENTLSSSFDDGNENDASDGIIPSGGRETTLRLNESELGTLDADEANMLEILAANNESSNADDGEKGDVNNKGINEDDDDDDDDDELLGKLVGKGPPSLTEEEEEEDDDDAASSAYDCESSSTIHLSNGMVLYLKEVDTMLALVCLTRAENFRKKSLINYNIGCLKRALMALPQPTTTNAVATAHHL